MMYLGFDIGKRAHHAALLDADGHVLRRLRFAPARAGLADPAAWLGDAAPTAVEVGLEATGIYWLTLHAWLRQWGAGTIRVLNPLRARAFRNANMRGTKADRAAASPSPACCAGKARTSPRTVCPRDGRPRRARSAASAPR